MTEIKRGTVAHRVLVELAGQNREMTIRQLFDALNGLDPVDYTPEQLHTAITDLAYGGTSYVKNTYNAIEGSYRLTWEGTELLRRLDNQPTDTAPMPRTRAQEPKKRWWRRG